MSRILAHISIFSDLYIRIYLPMFLLLAEGILSRRPPYFVPRERFPVFVPANAHKDLSAAVAKSMYIYIYMYVYPISI